MSDKKTTDDSNFERVPPQDLAAEQSVLGGMMLSKDAIGDVTEFIKNSGDYYRPAHGIIHDAILDLYSQGEPADPITVADELTKRGELALAGGPGYLHTLVDAVPTAANAEYYAEIVHERAALRNLIRAGTRIAGMGYAAKGELAEILNTAESELAAVVDNNDSSQAAYIGDDFEPYLDELDRVQRHGQTSGVTTGFIDLDALTSGGLKPGQMITIGGRPAMGKTTLGVTIARAAAIENGRRVAFFSLEMSRQELRDRVICAQGQINFHHLRKKGGMTDDDWTRFAKVTPQVTGAPLIIDDSPDMTIAQIKSRCRRIKQRGGLDLVVIDYLQLLQSGLKRVENRQTEVATMSRSIKLMAKELAVPVIVMAQLNRGPEQRIDKTPVASDLRESGSLEQDSDIVLLVHRPDAFEKESPRAGEADLIVAKHRGGPTATITVAFQGHYARFVDMSRDLS